MKVLGLLLAGATVFALIRDITNAERTYDAQNFRYADIPTLVRAATSSRRRRSPPPSPATGGSPIASSATRGALAPCL